MSAKNHRSQQASQTETHAEVRAYAPRLSLSSRWTPVATRPRLVTFSWGAVTPSLSKR